MKDEGKYCSLLFLHVICGEKAQHRSAYGSGNAFRNSSCVNCICGPSRAVILTGKHSQQNGFMDNGGKFNDDQ